MNGDIDITFRYTFRYTDATKAQLTCMECGAIVDRNVIEAHAEQHCRRSRSQAPTIDEAKQMVEDLKAYIEGQVVKPVDISTVKE
jgi:hypothetical protein